MAKINFSKVEELLEKGILKIEVGHLLELATIAKRIGAEPEDVEPITHLKHLLAFETRWFSKKDPDFYKKIGEKKKEIRQILEKQDPLTEPEIKKLEELEEKIKKYKEEYRKNLPEDYEEKLVEDERLKHFRYKRFNVNEKWLPLDYNQ